MATTKKAVTVYFDDHLYEKVAAAAKADKRSIANFIEAACDAVTVGGTHVALASRIERPALFEDFHDGSGDSRVHGEVFIWGERGHDRRRFDIPREVLKDKVSGDFKMSNAIGFCEQHRAKIEAACRLAWSLAAPSGESIMLTADHFQ